MRNETIMVDGQRWKVREARTRWDAEDAIAMARVTGSVGSRQLENGIVVADVVRLNVDGSEVQPS